MFRVFAVLALLLLVVPAQGQTTAPKVVERPAPAKKPITQRGWFWGVIGGVAVAVVAGAVVGLVLGTPSGDDTKILPPVRF